MGTSPTEDREGTEGGGISYQSLLKAQNRAFRVLRQSLKSGANYQTADELAYQEIFLPEGQNF